MHDQILQKIITHIDHTLEYCQGETFESFMNNRMLQEARIFNILQIGERSKFGLDEGVRLRIVWETISKDFAPLKATLESILNL